MKWYNLQSTDVVLIGDFPYFEDTNKVEISDMGIGTFKGVEVKKRWQSSVHNGEVYKTKSEAVENAKRNYESNIEFSDGTIPFEIVFYLRGIGWQIFSSNTVNNEHLIRNKMKSKSESLDQKIQKVAEKKSDRTVSANGKDFVR